MSRFPTTSWSLIRRATDESAAGSREQMDELLRRYWQPMFVHLRHKGMSAEKAEDLIQDFVLELLNNDLLAIADPDKGKFRTLVLVALDRFRAGKHRYDTAAKRSPGKVASLDAADSDPTQAAQGGPGLAFERAWCLDVLAQVLADMQRDCEAKKQATRWLIFEQRVLLPLFEGAEPLDYEQLAQKFQLDNAKVAANHLTSAKRQFARGLRSAIRDYVVRLADRPAQPSGAAEVEPARDENLQEHLIAQQVEKEIDELRSILAQSRGLTGAMTDNVIEDETKRQFWQRLNQQRLNQQGQGEQLGEIFEWGTNEGEPDDATLALYVGDLLDTSLNSLTGLGYEGPGTLRECLLDDQPPVPLLQGLKEWANVHRMGGDKAMPMPVAKVVYFLTLAVALVRCGERMTGASDHALAEGFRWLQDQSWLDVPLRETVDQAITSIQLGDC